MKTKYSSYLKKVQKPLQDLVKILDNNYSYVSILASDCRGTGFQVSQRRKNISDYDLGERGFVVRVYQDGLYSEYSFNELDVNDIERTSTKITSKVDEQLRLLKETNSEIFTTAQLEEKEEMLFEEKEVGVLPETVSEKDLMAKLTAISDKGVSLDERVIDFIVRAAYFHVNKLFVSKKKCMAQSYVYSEGMMAALVRSDTKTDMDYRSYSGLKGPELFEEMEQDVEAVVKDSLELLDAQRVQPGEYDIITTPVVSGLIAHEAFGHGVEMDMFVKNRALAADYIDKRVASDLVDMHEGALVAEDTSSYVFDDEGTLAGDVTEIKAGILKTGIVDALSALRLGIAPTGNGKRQSFERKAYTRMTNTVFMGGSDTLEDMIASIDYGYLLDGMRSGMEDPKHWGIQCMLSKGREIKDGKLTGVVVSPVILTGYVPDLLKSISMVSNDVHVHGAGRCGKGYKEWVKSAEGGPHLKAKGRLG